MHIRLSGHAGNPDLTLTEIMGYVFWPLAFCMGIPSQVFVLFYFLSISSLQDCLQVGKFIATKVVLNEFNAFADLAQYNPEKPDHLGDLEER